MKKLFVSAGLVAIGAAAFQSANADDSVSDPTISPRYWSVGGTLRGFYDSNYDTAGHSSFGFEVLPTVSLHVPLQQTDIGLRYTYGLYYYADRSNLNSNNDPFDQTHQVDFWLNHAFNERWKTKVSDTFVVAQEPELLSGPNPVAPQGTPFRVNGNNISNHGNVAVDTDWTRLLSTEVTYQNGLYNYQNDGAVVLPNSAPPGFTSPYFGIPNPPQPGPSEAGLLNRIEQYGSIDLKYNFDPETIFLIGYQFGWTDYTAGEPIQVITVPQNFTYVSNNRNTYTDYMYVGAQHSFTPNLAGTVKAGATYTDPYNDPLFSSSSWYPYADMSLSYTYLPGSYVQFGFTQDVSSTDVIAAGSNGSITQYANASVVYADINHRITPKLTGSVIGRLQYNSFQGGSADASGQTSTFYSVGVNLNYQVNHYLSVDAGYNYDDVSSDIPGYAYTRNRVYLGLTVNY